MRQEAALVFGAQQHFRAHIAQRPGADDPAEAKAIALGAASASSTTTATNGLVTVRRIRMTPTFYHARKRLPSGPIAGGSTSPWR